MAQNVLGPSSAGPSHSCPQGPAQSCFPFSSSGSRAGWPIVSERKTLGGRTFPSAGSQEGVSQNGPAFFFPSGILLKNVFERPRDRDRETNRDLPPAGSLPNCLPWPGRGQAKATNPKLNLGLPCGWQEPNFFSHRLCLPECAVAGNWNQEQSWELSPGTLIWGAGVSGSLPAAPHTCPGMLLRKEIGSWRCGAAG